MRKLKSLLQLMRFDKPIGTLLLLWPTLWALWLSSNGAPPLNLLLIFCAGVIVMRAAGCVVNDLADRHVDGAVRRTKHRPLVTHAVSPKEALLLFMTLAVFAFSLVLMLNTFTIMLSFIGLGLAILYPFSKRFILFPQLILGLAWNWGIILVFSATTESLPPLAWALYVIGVLWTVAYDTEYAMVDRDDDLLVGIKSSAIWFSQHDIAVIMILFSLFLLGLTIIGLSLHLNICFWISLLFAAVFVVYQFTLLRSRNRENYFKAFLNNHWIGTCIFLGIVSGMHPIS